MSKHTPGPWEFSGTWVQTSDDKKQPIANFNFAAATRANARLIAAAPELLEVLRQVVVMAKTGLPEYGADDIQQVAEAAIAKATGEQA